MLTIKQGDTRHAVRALLQTQDGLAIDLTGASITFKMKHYLKDLTVEKAITPEQDGYLNVVFNSPDTDVEGKYNAEFTVEYLDGRVETFPNSGYIEIQIERKVGGVL